MIKRVDPSHIAPVAAFLVKKINSCNKEKKKKKKNRKMLDIQLKYATIGCLSDSKS